MTETPTFPVHVRTADGAQLEWSATTHYLSGYRRKDAAMSARLVDHLVAHPEARGLLAEVGLTFADVTEITSYHVGLTAQMETFIAVKDAYVTAPYPAWTAVGVCELAIPGAVTEIQITARLS